MKPRCIFRPSTNADNETALRSVSTLMISCQGQHSGQAQTAHKRGLVLDVQERCCLLQVERPDRGQRVKGCKRGNKTMGATKKEAAGAEEYHNEKRLEFAHRLVIDDNLKVD